MPKPPPIVIVPNKTYITDKNIVIPSDVIVVVDATIYTKIRMSLANAARRNPNDKP